MATCTSIRTQIGVENPLVVYGAKVLQGEGGGLAASPTLQARLLSIRPLAALRIQGLLLRGASQHGAVEVLGLGASLVAVDTRFEGNAAWAGGALLVSRGAVATLEGCTFTGNGALGGRQGGWGAAVALARGGTFQSTGSVFMGSWPLVGHPVVYAPRGGYQAAGDRLERCPPGSRGWPPPAWAAPTRGTAPRPNPWTRGRPRAIRPGPTQTTAAPEPTVPASSAPTAPLGPSGA